MAQHDLDNFLLLSSYLHFTTYYRSVVVVRSSFGGGDGGRSSLCVFEVLLSLAAGREKRVKLPICKRNDSAYFNIWILYIMWFNIIFFRPVPLWPIVFSIVFQYSYPLRSDN